MLLSILIGFLFGVLAVVGAEAFFVVFAVGHLRRRKRPAQTEAEEERTEARDLDAEQSLAFLCNKQVCFWWFLDFFEFFGCVFGVGLLVFVGI